MRSVSSSSSELCHPERNRERKQKHGCYHEENLKYGDKALHRAQVGAEKHEGKSNRPEDRERRKRAKAWLPLSLTGPV